VFSCFACVCIVVLFEFAAIKILFKDLVVAADFASAHKLVRSHDLLLKRSV
jgi:hypothetical protein